MRRSKRSFERLGKGQITLSWKMHWASASSAIIKSCYVSSYSYQVQMDCIINVPNNRSGVKPYRVQNALFK